VKKILAMLAALFRVLALLVLGTTAKAKTGTGLATARTCIGHHLAVAE
jgi:hypothetical protein